MSGNTSTIYAGGISLSTFVGKLIGTTVYSNSAKTWGGVQLHMENSLAVANCVMWMNTDTTASTDLFEENLEQPSVAWSFLRHSCVEGWNGYGGATNTGLDPLFIDGFGADGQPGTGDDDLRQYGVALPSPPPENKSTAHPEIGGCLKRRGDFRVCGTFVLRGRRRECDSVLTRPPAQASAFASATAAVRAGRTSNASPTMP